MLDLAPSVARPPSFGLPSRNQITRVGLRERLREGSQKEGDRIVAWYKLEWELGLSTTKQAKSNINPNASVGAPKPGTNGTHTKILDFDSKGA